MVVELGRALDGRETRPAPVDEDDAELLDAYSRAVTAAAERIIPSVASLRITRNGGPGGGGSGAGSGVGIGADGYLLASAHVAAGVDRATAAVADGRGSPGRGVGRHRLSGPSVVRPAGDE